jgi:Family of unknown function (DUF5709)
MPQEWRHESEDLADFEVLDAADTLTGPPGDDPLDRGVVTPDRWSAAMRFGSTAAEQEAGESLDQLLAEEEPDISLEVGVDPDQADGWDENATEAEIRKLAEDATADPRAGRLAPEDQDGFSIANADLVARDAGIDGGAATAEEAAIHLVIDDEG